MTDPKSRPLLDKGNLVARRFKTILSGALAKSAVNFGGHYVAASWGCGTNCQRIAIVDVLTGKATEWAAMMYTVGDEPNQRTEVIQANSRLVIYQSIP